MNNWIKTNTKKLVYLPLFNIFWIDERKYPGSEEFMVLGERFGDTVECLGRFETEEEALNFIDFLYKNLVENENKSS